MEDEVAVDVGDVGLPVAEHHLGQHSLHGREYPVVKNINEDSGKGVSGEVNGHAVRVPLTNASLTDCVFEVERPTTVEEVNGFLQSASEGALKGILGYETRPLVSIDFQTDPRSSIVDALSTLVINGTQVKIYVWYDNEWGYVNRTAELVEWVGASDL